MPEVADLTLAGQLHAREHFQKLGLAVARDPSDGHNLAGTYREVEFIQRFHALPVAQGQVFNLKHLRAGRKRCPRELAVEVLRVAEAPREGEEHSAWRFADEVIDQLRMLGTAKAGDAVVEVARLCTGNCEGSGGSCLWRERDRIKNAIEAIGGPERDARYAAVNALVAADKK